MEGDTLIKSSECPPEIPYREIVGGLLYIARTVRPDIMHSVAYLGQFSAAYNMTHFNAAKRVLIYLKNTSELGLKLTRSGRSNISIQITTDSDWASNRLDRKSMSGSVSMLNGNIVNWTSKRQSSVALSSTEAEIYGMSVGVTDAFHIWHICEDTDDS